MFGVHARHPAWVSPKPGKTSNIQRCVFIPSIMPCRRRLSHCCRWVFERVAQQTGRTSDTLEAEATRMYRILLLPVLLAGCGQDQAINKLEPKLAFSPGAIEFGEVAVDYTATFSVEIINAGAQGLDVNAIHFGGGNPGIFSVEPTRFSWPWTNARRSRSRSPPTRTSCTQTTWSSSPTILKTPNSESPSPARVSRHQRQTSRSLL